MFLLVFALKAAKVVTKIQYSKYLGSNFVFW